MNGDQLEAKLKNGWGARIAAGVLVVLLSTSAIGTYKMAVSFSALSQKVESFVKYQESRGETVDHRIGRHDQRLDSLDKRLRAVERGNNKK